MEIEHVTIAEEMEVDNAPIFEQVTKDFSEIEQVNHETFKALTKNAKAIIRTGEATPYANIILQSGVIF